MSDKYLIDEMDNGNIKIADDVIATIAVVAAEKVEGVINMQSTLKSSVTDMLGVKNIARGVKVTVGEEETVIDMFVNVLYGKNIVEICKQVQLRVKEAIESMTGLNVVEVNVHVSGISLSEKDKARA